MLGRICAHIHNYFTDDTEPVSGSWTIEDGMLNLDGVVRDGQYFRIIGSDMNDGVYKAPAVNLIDETFVGQIWPMRVPRAFVALAAEIGQWQKQYGAAMASPYQSESVVGVYSYSKGGAGGAGAASGADAWQGVFRSRLNEWRKLA